WYQLNYVEPTGIDTLVMTTMDSGVSTAILKVNWAKIQMGGFAGLPLYFVPKSYAQLNLDLLNTRVKRWKNKKWYADGDSMTEQNIYPWWVNLYCEFTSYYNAGQSGLGMQHMAEKFAVEPLTNYDLITVFAGTNDYGGSTPLGTMADDKTAASFYGYTKMVIDAILTSKPTIRVAFFTPIQRGNFTGQPVFPAPNSAGFTLDQYVDAIITVCKSFGVPVLDLFRVSGINQYNFANYLQDGLHPNNTGGGALLGRQIQSFLEVI
ncbi:MAG TPA: SGNH/GDSL hydrolase family protein, partial [Clostridium sp.]